MPRVSVVIPNWNGMKFLKACLDALRAQRFADFETVVVDNGSSDGSVEFIAAEYPEVKLVRFAENLGFSRAVNAGIRIGGGDYVALLNNDTMADPGWLETMVEALGRRKDVGLAAARVMFMDRPDIIDSAGDEYTAWGAVFNRGHNLPLGENFAMEQEVFGVCASAAVARRAMLDEIGLFDENFFAYYEDIDISFRARLAGWKCLYVPDAVVLHGYSGSTSGTTGKLGREEVYLHLTGVWLKNMPPALMFRHFFSAVAFNKIIIFFYILARIRGKAMMPRVRFFRLMAAMLSARSDVQSKRKATVEEISGLFLKLGLVKYLREELRGRKGNGKQPAA